jgi:phage terminase large subunit-like protein
MMETEVIERPNGKAYRPRKVIAYIVVDGYEDACGVVVLGTQDVARAQVLADQLVRAEVDGGCVAAAPAAVWWRDSFEYGQRRWVSDEVRGRAGVLFTDIIEAGN